MTSRLLSPKGCSLMVCSNCCSRIEAEGKIYPPSYYKENVTQIVAMGLALLAICGFALRSHTVLAVSDNYPAQFEFFYNAGLTAGFPEDGTMADTSSTYIGNVVGSSGRAGYAVYDVNASSSPIAVWNDTTNSNAQGQTLTSMLTQNGNNSTCTNAAGGICPGALPNGTYYWFVGRSGAVGSPNILGTCLGHSAADCFTGGAEFGLVQFTVNNSIAPPLTPGISFERPLSGNSVADFQTWAIAASSTTALGPLGGKTIIIDYGCNPATYAGSIGSCPFQDSLVIPSNVPYYVSDIFIAKSQTLKTLLYFAEAHLLNSSGTAEIANSGLISFTIDSTFPPTLVPSSTTPYAYSTSTNLLSPGALACVDGVSFEAFGCYLELAVGKIGQFLFVPSTDLTTQFQVILASYKNIFPFQIFFGITDSVQQGIATASSSPPGTLTLSIPGLHYGQDDFTVVVLTSTTLKTVLTTTHCDSTCAQGHKDALFSVLTMLIWLGASLEAIHIITSP